MIVVTGGAGFIGSNLVAGLEEAGAGDIVVVDRFGRDDKWRNLAKRAPADIVRPEALGAFLAAHADAIDTVFHLGAISATTERDVDLIVAENIRATLDLWGHCRDHGARLIYASSAATYGDGSAGFEDDEQSQSLSRLLPLNPYGWSKHVVDRRLTRLAAEGRPTPPQWAGLKFFNVYGPNEYHKGEMRSVIAKITPDLARGAPARLFRSHHADYADGGQMRDFVHVDDCVAVMLWLWRHPTVSGLFNVGSGEARSWNDLAHAIFAALGRVPAIDYIEMPEVLRDRYQYFTQASMSKLRQAGYDRPFRSLEDGIADYVKNYLIADDPYR
ncbi:MAG: ADP-glyceromanno-heptose 6-epimerase [Azospirillaceae bacterium]